MILFRLRRFWCKNLVVVLAAIIQYVVVVVVNAPRSTRWRDCFPHLLTCSDSNDYLLKRYFV